MTFQVGKVLKFISNLKSFVWPTFRVTESGSFQSCCPLPHVCCNSSFCMSCVFVCVSFSCLSASCFLSTLVVKQLQYFAFSSPALPVLPSYLT